jgi:hypothetical protein
VLRKGDTREVKGAEPNFGCRAKRTGNIIFLKQFQIILENVLKHDKYPENSKQFQKNAQR